MKSLRMGKLTRRKSRDHDVLLFLSEICLLHTTHTIHLGHLREVLLGFVWSKIS